MNLSTAQRQKWDYRWSSFKPEEVYSPESLLICPHVLDETAMDNLQFLRSKIDRPILINHNGLTLRGVRTFAENEKIKGATNSMHVHGKAFDITVPGMSIAELAQFVENIGLFTGIGVYATWVHVDTRFDLFNYKPVKWRA